MTTNIYNMADTWNAIGTTFDAIKMNVTDGAAGFPVGAAASQLINIQTNATQRFGVRSPHFALGADITPFLNLVDIWNTSGAAVGIKYNATDTASASASLLMDLQLGGVSKFNVTKAGTILTGVASGSVILASNVITNGIYLQGVALGFIYGGVKTCLIGSGFISFNSTATISWTSSSDPNGTIDLNLYRDAANTLAQRNSTTAQIFNIYNTFTDVSNYERGFLRWTANTLILGNEVLGTGTARDVAIQTPNGTATWTFFNASKILACPGHVQNGGGFTGFQIGTLGGLFGTNTDGVFKLLNNATTDFTRLCLGVNTNLFPALARIGTGVQFQTGDGATTGTWYKSTVLTLASLSASVISAASAGSGGMAFVTDLTTASFVLNTTAAGGGSLAGPVFSDGTQWRAG